MNDPDLAADLCAFSADLRRFVEGHQMWTLGQCKCGLSVAEHHRAHKALMRRKANLLVRCEADEAARV